jgi:hypothetical protein
MFDETIGPSPRRAENAGLEWRPAQNLHKNQQMLNILDKRPAKRPGIVGAWQG